MQSVTFFEEFPQFELLPVLKTRYFIGECKPLMYVRLAAVAQGGLVLDLMKFERDPSLSADSEHNDIIGCDSCVAVSLTFPEDKNIASYAINSKGKTNGFLNGNPDPHVGNSVSEVFSYRGADEQGWYWGTRFSIAPQQAPSSFQKHSFVPGKTFLCNAFVFQNGGEATHFGAVLPVCSRDIFARENLSEFTVCGDQ